MTWKFVAVGDDVCIFNHKYACFSQQLFIDALNTGLINNPMWSVSIFGRYSNTFRLTKNDAYLSTKQHFDIDLQEHDKSSYINHRLSANKSLNSKNNIIKKI